MAKSRIEGITIEIDGNTKPLKKSLETVNRTIANTRDSLRDVDRLLKLDPGNTELLTQKQRLLSEAVEGTEEKLKQLKIAQQQAKAQLEKGELGQEKYEALQREIVATNNTLENLKSQAKATNSALKKSTSGIDAFSDAAEKASGKVSGLSKAAGGLLAAAAATVPATEELWRDLSFLEKNAKKAGISMGATEKAFKTFNTVSGETDSSVEAVSNLLQAGFTESNLQKAVEGVAGAVTDFPDTLKVESMADSIQETIASGKSIGQFSEYLDRVGIGAANFDKELAKCASAAEKQNLALEALAKGGGNDSFNLWKKSNPELVKYQDAMLELQTTFKEFAVSIAPVVTEVTKFATKALNEFNELPPAAKKSALAITAITAATGPALSGVARVATGVKTLSEILPKASAGAKGLSTSSGILSGALKAVPYAAAAVGVAGLAVAIYKGIDAMNAETDAAVKAASARSKAVESVKSETKETDLYFQKLKELEAVENKTTTQKQLMQTYIDKLNGSVEGLNLSYDAEKDKLNQSTNAIYKKIEAQKQEAIQAAYLKQSKKALEDYAEAQIKLADKQTELKNKTEEYNAIAEKGASISMQEAQQKAALGQEINNLEREVNDLTTASDKYNQEAQKLTNQAALQGQAWQNLLNEAGITAKQIPETLVAGIKEGQYKIPTTVQELNELIEFSKAAENAKGAGVKIAEELSRQIAAGEISITDATKKLTTASATELEKGVQTAGQKGAQSSEKYAAGVRGQSTKVQEAAKAVANSANSGFGSVDQTSAGRKSGTQYISGVSEKKEAATTTGKSLAKAGRTGANEISWETAGKNAGKGYTIGLKSTLTAIGEAGAAIAKTALNAAKKAAKEGSPAKEWIKSAEFAGDGYTIGLKNSISQVKKAGAAVANAALVGAKNTGKAIGNISATDYSSMKSQIKADFDYLKMASIMKESVSGINFTITLDQRELGRGLRGMGVQFQ